VNNTREDIVKEHEKLLIIDFGSQVTKLIARRVRESGVYSEVHPFNKVDAEYLSKFDPKAIILSGGPSSVTGAGSPRAHEAVWSMDVPILGICYGQQTMCAQLGGAVESSDEQEFGRAYVDTSGSSPLFAGLSDREEVWMSHGDRVSSLPDGFEVIGVSPNAPYAAIADESRKYYGVQYHPEVVHTPNGAKMLRNFTHDIAGFKGDWSMASFKDEMIQAVRDQVGDGKVICGLSGGVDSSVAAVLIHEAIGDQLTCVYVDTGMMRKGESDQVTALFRDHYDINLIHVDAGDEFLSLLDGVSDPEKKRKIIGGTFIDIFEREAKKVGGAKFLAQGTLYPDRLSQLNRTIMLADCQSAWT